MKVTDTNLEEILNTDKPVMIDFWATWCGPCRAIAPVVEELAGEYEGKAVIAKCNVDECEQVPMRFGIRNIPTLLFFKDGAMKEKLVGSTTKAAIVAKMADVESK